jgi:hypothetical protein
VDTERDILKLSAAGARSRTRTSSRLVVCAVALALAVAILGSGIFHVHSTPEAAAACTVCHIGHVPVIAASLPGSLVPEPVVFSRIARIAPAQHSSADFSCLSSRAPPAIA